MYVSETPSCQNMIQGCFYGRSCARIEILEQQVQKYFVLQAPSDKPSPATWILPREATPSDQVLTWPDRLRPCGFLLVIDSSGQKAKFNVHLCSSMIQTTRHECQVASLQVHLARTGDFGFWAAIYSEIGWLQNFLLLNCWLEILKSGFRLQLKISFKIISSLRKKILWKIVYSYGLLK